MGLKNDRLSGKSYSYHEINRGTTNKGSIEKGRIRIGINKEGELILEDGRHLLQAYVNLGKDIPIRSISFSSNEAEKLFTELIQ